MSVRSMRVGGVRYMVCGMWSVRGAGAWVREHEGSTGVWLMEEAGTGEMLVGVQTS